MRAMIRFSIVVAVFGSIALFTAPKVATGEEYQKWSPKDASSDQARYAEFYAAVKEICEKAEKSQAASPDFLRDLKALLEKYAPKTTQTVQRADDKPTVVTKRINASDSEFVTVMAVQRGQKLRIETTGKWVAVPRQGECDADGKSYPKKEFAGQVLERAVVGYLEGSIGGGVPFKIGKSLGEYEVASDGDLKMRMHDDPTWGPGYSDNTGFIEVKVTVLPAK